VGSREVDLVRDRPAPDRSLILLVTKERQVFTEELESIDYVSDGKRPLSHTAGSRDRIARLSRAAPMRAQRSGRAVSGARAATA